MIYCATIVGALMMKGTNNMCQHAGQFNTGLALGAGAGGGGLTVLSVYVVDSELKCVLKTYLVLRENNEH